MLALLILFLVIAGLGLRMTTHEQRVNMLRTLDTWLSTAVDKYQTHGREELAAFHTAVRTRAKWPLVTLSLAVLNAAAFLWMRSRGLPQNDPGALLAWGASFGPRTSNGEWWRLVSAMFVHVTFISLIVDVAAIVQAGWMLECMAGGPAVAVAFVGGGLFSGLRTLSLYPTGVITSASGAVAGLYGLLAIVAIAGWVRRSAVTVPLAALERLLPIAIIFAIHAAADPQAGGTAPFSGVATGLIVGLVAVRGLHERVPPPRRMAIAAAAGLIVAAGLAVSLRGILDIRPEIADVVRLENQTSGEYGAAALRFQKGRMTAEELARLVEQTIVPELQAADAHISGLHGVPVEDAPRVADAREYLRLRIASWQLRAEGLRLTDRSVRGTSRSSEDSDVAFRVRAQTMYQTAQLASGKADGAERTSLVAFEKLQPASNVAAK